MTYVLSVQFSASLARSIGSKIYFESRPLVLNIKRAANSCRSKTISSPLCQLFRAVSHLSFGGRRVPRELVQICPRARVRGDVCAGARMRPRPAAVRRRARPPRTAAAGWSERAYAPSRPLHNNICTHVGGAAQTAGVRAAHQTLYNTIIIILLINVWKL